MVSAAQYDAARRRAAVIGRRDRLPLIVSGRDRASYLQGLLTNDVAALTAGQGCYAAYLTPQGRMLADLFVYELGESMLLTTPREQHRFVLDRLEQFVFAEDVQVADASDALTALAVVGPQAAELVGTMLGMSPSVLSAMSEHANRRCTWRGNSAIVTRITDTGEPGYDLYVPPAEADVLQQALAAAGAPLLDAEAADVLRLEAGIPRFGPDMDTDSIPLEAGLESRAISFSKGCYVGQEVIVRVLHRGHGRVARKLWGIVLEGEGAPPPGAAVAAGGREVGRITSSAESPALGRPIALAYLHREAAVPGTAVLVAGRSGVVARLPFVEPAGGGCP